jgi:hypothetical protein
MALAAVASRTSGVDRAGATGVSGRGAVEGASGEQSSLWLEFLYEMGEIAARGGDVRQHILGAPDELGQAEAA